MAFVRSTDRNQLTIVPQSLDDQIAGDSDVRILDAFVRGMRLERLGFTRTASFTGRGAAQYSAEALMRVVLYGFYYHLPSSRKLAWLCATNVEVQWLTGNLRPTHATINTFVQENGDALAAMFRQFVEFLKAANLVDGQTVALDGTKIKASASRDMVSPESMRRAIARTQKQIAEYMAMLTEDDDDHHPDGGLSARVAALGGVEAVKAMVEQLEERKNTQQILQTQVTESAQRYYSPTDPDARMMRTRQGKVAGYNCQIAVDSKHGYLVSATVVQDQNDSAQLTARVEDIVVALGTVESVVADSGYYAGAQIVGAESLATRGVAVYVNVPESVGRGSEGFVYDAQEDRYRCPVGHEMPVVARNTVKRGQRYTEYRCDSCDGCPRRAACTTSLRGRSIKRNVDADILERHNARALSPAGKALLAKRKTTVEHVCGSIKTYLGSTFRTRGRPKVAIETCLASITYNLKRLTSMWNTELAMKLAQMTV